jgi:hypothetical protein
MGRFGNVTPGRFQASLTVEAGGVEVRPHPSPVMPGRETRFSTVFAPPSRAVRPAFVSWFTSHQCDRLALNPAAGEVRITSAKPT